MSVTSRIVTFLLLKIDAQNINDSKASDMKRTYHEKIHSYWQRQMRNRSSNSSTAHHHAVSNFSSTLGAQRMVSSEKAQHGITKLTQ